MEDFTINEAQQGKFEIYLSNLPTYEDDFLRDVDLRKFNNFVKSVNVPESSMNLQISKTYGGGFYHHAKVNPTSSNQDFIDNCLDIFDRYYHDEPIRRVSIVAGNLSSKDSHQLNLFENFQDFTANEKINDAIDKVHDKFGKNSLVKASSLLPDSTAIERNKKIGGHNA